MTAAIVTMSIRRAVTSVHNACTRTAVIQSRKGRDSKDHQEQNCDNQNLFHGVVSSRFSYCDFSTSHFYNTIPGSP